MTDSINMLKPSGCFEIHKVIGISTIHGNCRSYQVQWAPSWISGAHLIGCEDLIEQFENEQQKEKVFIKIEVNDEREVTDIENDRITCLPNNNNEVVTFEQEPQQKDIDSPQDRLSEINTNEVEMQDKNLCNDFSPFQEITTALQEDVSRYTSSSSYLNNIKCQGKVGLKLASLDSAVRTSVHPDFHGLKMDMHGEHSNNKGSVVVNTAEEMVLVSNFVDGESCSFQNVLNFCDGNRQVYTAGKSFGKKRGRQNRKESNGNIVNVKLRNTRTSSIPCTGNNEEKKIKAMETFQCNVCNKAFSNELTLKNHAKLHNCIHQCMICSKTFASREKLQRHKGMHNTCSICEMTFSNTEELKKHIETHKRVNGNPLECPYCEKRFPSKSQVMAHERVHTGERPFKCNICEAAFKKKQDLQQHDKKHT